MAITMTEHCATCGKESDSLKTCSGCNDTKYCNADCQKAHRKQHKADCKKKAAEFEVALFEIGRRAAELFDEILFKKQPPPREDCPICMLQLPSTEYIAYQMCCGKVICCGCIDAMGASDDCPFCRKPAASTAIECIDRLNIRMELGDSNAFTQMGGFYDSGSYGLKQDKEKALEMSLRAADLGSTLAHNNIANAYYEGTGGVEKDPNREMHHYQQAAIGGCALARHNIGFFEAKAGNIDRAIKHWMIAAGSGMKESLDCIRQQFMRGYATKCEYETALREYQAYIEEVKSFEREKAKRKGMVGGSLYTQWEEY